MYMALAIYALTIVFSSLLLLRDTSSQAYSQQLIITHESSLVVLIWDLNLSIVKHTCAHFILTESRWLPPEGYIPKAERNTDTNADITETSQPEEETANGKEDGDQAAGDEKEQNEESSDEKDETESRGTKRKLVSRPTKIYG